MLLCDIGNTSWHFFDGSSSYKKEVGSFEPISITETVHYVNVNSKVQEQLEKLDNWIDLAAYIDWSRYYDSMGIDRVMVCEAVEHAIVIDAGSAITVDVVRNGNFEGGFIYPGVDAMQRCYRSISPRLDYSFNFELDLDKMPKNSRDAVSYGFLRPFYDEVMRHDLPILLTGGNAAMLQPLFPDAKLDEMLVFKGMQKIIEKVC